MIDLPFALPEFEPGWVWLAGAGPGDPGLLTLLAVHGLAHADVVVHDALVSPEVLSLARPGAVLDSWGKRGGRPSPKQEDVSRRLAELAHQGRRVLRLKGGDPFLFGRGSEEAQALVRAAVPFRIIPGITAGIGGLAYAGIPATAREVNSVVSFVTGHDDSGDIPAIDWPALARSSPVIVLYMAMARLQDITRALLDAGRSAVEPVAVVERATTERQRVLETTLGECVRDVAAGAMEAPAIVVIGRVVALRETLNWLGT